MSSGSPRRPATAGEHRRTGLFSGCSWSLCDPNEPENEPGNGQGDREAAGDQPARATEADVTRIRLSTMSALARSTTP